jgi:hypothetical protein
MNFVVLLYQDPSTFAMSDAERQGEWQEYGAFTEAIRADGTFVNGSPVVPDNDQARLVRVVGGKTEVMTGQLPSRKERLVGLYTLNCASADAAAALAAKLPAARKGFIEIVPEMEM